MDQLTETDAIDLPSPCLSSGGSFTGTLCFSTYSFFNIVTSRRRPFYRVPEADDRRRTLWKWPLEGLSRKDIVSNLTGNTKLTSGLIPWTSFRSIDGVRVIDIATFALTGHLIASAKSNSLTITIAPRSIDCRWPTIDIFQLYTHCSNLALLVHNIANWLAIRNSETTAIRTYHSSLGSGRDRCTDTRSDAYWLNALFSHPSSTSFFISAVILVGNITGRPISPGASRSAGASITLCAKMIDNKSLILSLAHWRYPTHPSIYRKLFKVFRKHKILIGIAIQQKQSQELFKYDSQVDRIRFARLPLYRSSKADGRKSYLMRFPESSILPTSCPKAHFNGV